MRLIDAERLCYDLLHAWHTKDEEYSKNVRNVILDVVTPIVTNQPTIEAQPVVKAQWVDGVAYNAYSCKLCSNCGAIMPSDSSIDYIDEEDNKYCYNCGAKMEDVKQ